MGLFCEDSPACLQIIQRQAQAMARQFCDILLLLPTPAFSLAEQVHDFHELIMPVRGDYGYFDQGRRIPVTVGQGVWYPAGTSHRSDYLRDGSVAVLMLQWRDSDLDLPLQVFNDRNGHLIGALQWLWELKGNVKDPRVSALRKNLIASVGNQLRLLAEGFEAQGPRFQDPLGRVVNYLHVNYSTAITIAQLTALAEMRRSTFMAAFRRHYGTTPMVMLTDIRMRQAAHQLQVLQRDEADAAKAVGYQSLDHFRRVFRKYYGQAVQAWLLAQR